MASASIETAADDWFVAADQFRLNSAKGLASITFKIGSMSIRFAALIAAVGKISGNSVPDSLDYELDTIDLNIFGTAFSLKALNGRSADVSQGSRFGPSALLPVAFRRNGKVLFNAEMSADDTSDFNIRGLWILKRSLVFSDTFVV